MISAAHFRHGDTLTQLVFDPLAATVVTFFSGSDAYTGGTVAPDDGTHASRLGMTPLEHRLHHELAHHFIGITCAKLPYSPTLRKAAGLSVVHPTHSGLALQEAFGAGDSHEEWYVTALQYFARGRSADHGALVNMQGCGNDVRALTDLFSAVFECVRSGATVMLDVERIRERVARA